MDLKNKTDAELSEMLSDEMETLCDRAKFLRDCFNYGHRKHVNDEIKLIGTLLENVKALRDELVKRGVLKK